jgi:hypothetical protein
VKESDGEDLCGAPGATVLAAGSVIQLGGKFAELQSMATVVIFVRKKQSQQEEEGAWRRDLGKE